MSKMQPWIVLDLETTGLDPTKDLILECAAIAVDPVSLQPLEGHAFNMIVSHPNTELELAMSDFVRDMHTKNGLLAQISDSRMGAELPLYDTTNHETLDNWLCAFLIGVSPEKLMLVGNSVQFDKEFLRYACPQTHERLSHRIIDVSTFRESYKAWCGELEKGEPAHRAMDDVKSSLAQLRGWRHIMQAGDGVLKGRAGG